MHSDVVLGYCEHSDVILGIMHSMSYPHKVCTSTCGALICVGLFSGRGHIVSMYFIKCSIEFVGGQSFSLGSEFRIIREINV